MESSRVESSRLEASWVEALVAALGAEPGSVRLGDVGTPDLGPVVDVLGGAEQVARLARAEQDAGRPWPRPIDRPAALGPAQWAALLGAAARLVEQTRAVGDQRVLQDRRPDADERRLLNDVPPHHQA